MAALALLFLLLLSAPPLPAAEVPAVEVLVLEPATLPEELRLHGSLEPGRQADLAPQVGGVVTQRPVDLGQAVKAGQLLLQLDPRRYDYQRQLRQAEVDAARSRRDLAERGLERAASLVGDSTLSQEAFDQARYEAAAAASQEAMARAGLGLAELDLEQSAVRAPFAGEVAAVLVQLGEQVAPGQPVVRLAQCDTVEIRANLSAADLTWLEPGLPVRVAPASGGAPFQATLTHLTRVADPASRRYAVRITAPVAAADLVFGSLADLTVVGRAARPGVLAPISAVRTLAGATRAYVVVERDGLTRLEERSVRVARELPGGQLFVVGGLAAGERLALSAGVPLSDGLRVEVEGVRRLGPAVGDDR